MLELTINICTLLSRNQSFYRLVTRRMWGRPVVATDYKIVVNSVAFNHASVHPN